MASSSGNSGSDNAVVSFGSTFGLGIICGGIALASGASKTTVAIAFVSGVVAPPALMLVLVLGVCAFTRLSINKQLKAAQTVKPAAPEPQPKAAPALASVPDIAKDFHEGTDNKVTAMKPLRLKASAPQAPSSAI